MGKVFEYAIEFAEESGKDLHSFETSVAFQRHVAQKSRELERIPSKIRIMTLEDFLEQKRGVQSKHL